MYSYIRISLALSTITVSYTHLMDMRHIDYLCREIKSIRKGSIETIRILGGEPLLSKILEPAVQAFALLKDEGYISNINIVTNGNLPIPAYCSPYIVFAPQIVEMCIRDRSWRYIYPLMGRTAGKYLMEKPHKPQENSHTMAVSYTHLSITLSPMAK